MQRQAQQVDHALGAHDRDDAEIDDAGEKAEHPGEQAKLAAVAHLEELAEGHGAGFAVAVDHIPGGHEQQPDRDGDVAPPVQTEPALVEALERGDEDHRPRPLLAAGRADQEPAGVAAARHEVRHALDILPRIDGDAAADDQRDQHDQPVHKMHFHEIGSGVGWSGRRARDFFRRGCNNIRKSRLL